MLLARPIRWPAQTNPGPAVVQEFDASGLKG